MLVNLDFSDDIALLAVKESLCQKMTTNLAVHRFQDFFQISFFQSEMDMHIKHNCLCFK